MPLAAEIDTPERLIAPALGALPGVRHGFFTRRGGVSTGPYASLNTGTGSDDDRAAVLENRARVAAVLGAPPTHLLTPTQVHGTKVVVATLPWAPGGGPEADAVVADRPGLAVGIGTADCAPVLFADHKAGVVAAAHAGWRGALEGVLEATVAAMEQLGARRYRIVAAIGPAIAQPSYEVGPEFREQFLTADPENDRFFRPADRPGHALFDLPAYVAARLATRGLAAVEDLRLDTYADPARFFSHRRGTHAGAPDYGRMVSAIALV